MLLKYVIQDAIRKFTAYPVRYWAGTPDCPDGFYMIFRRSVEAIEGVYFKSGHECFLPHSFQFTIIQSFEAIESYIF
jgi:hypothetical protein